jgi:hypothetical protein
MRYFFFIFILCVTLHANSVANFKGQQSVIQGQLNYNIPLKLPKGSAAF